MATRMDDVMSGLAALFAAQPGISSSAAVYDAQPVASNQYDPLSILVGDDGDPESNEISSYTFEWANLARTRRDEWGEIICAAISETGDVDVKTMRDSAFALIDICDDAIRADITLGGLVMTAELIQGQSQIIQNEEGTAAVASFTVRYWARV